jgi:hypothetical protein
LLTANALYNIPLKTIGSSAIGRHCLVTCPDRPFNVPGFGGAIGTGTVNVDDIESVLGRASLRVGTTIPAAVTAAVLHASVFHERWRRDGKIGQR